MSEMAYCAPLGLPHSTFKTWPELDQAKALAWRTYEAEKCPRCHQHPENWSEVVNGARRPLREPMLEYQRETCYSCAELEAFKEAAFGEPDSRTQAQKDDAATSRIRLAPFSTIPPDRGRGSEDDVGKG